MCIRDRFSCYIISAVCLVNKGAVSDHPQKMICLSVKCTSMLQWLGLCQVLSYSLAVSGGGQEGRVRMEKRVEAKGLERGWVELSYWVEEWIRQWLGSLTKPALHVTMYVCVCAMFTSHQLMLATKTNRIQTNEVLCLFHRHTTSTHTVLRYSFSSQSVYQ